MNHECPWCHRQMKKVNDASVYECGLCKTVIQFQDCSHTNYRQYSTAWMSMKKCLACGEEFDMHARKPLEFLLSRAKNRENCAKRLRAVVEAEKKRRGLKI